MAEKIAFEPLMKEIPQESLVLPKETPKTAPIQINLSDGGTNPQSADIYSVPQGKVLKIEWVNATLDGTTGLMRLYLINKAKYNEIEAADIYERFFYMRARGALSQVYPDTWVAEGATLSFAAVDCNGWSFSIGGKLYDKKDYPAKI